jgi:hypothetical protein
MCAHILCVCVHSGRACSGIVPGRLFAGPGDGCVGRLLCVWQTEGWTPLCIACKSGLMDVAWALLDGGADISLANVCVQSVCVRAHGGKVGSGVVPGRLFAGPGDGCVCVRPLLYVAGGWLDALVHRQ